MFSNYIERISKKDNGYVNLQIIDTMKQAIQGIKTYLRVMEYLES